jgi:hypothetical protein
MTLCAARRGPQDRTRMAVVDESAEHTERLGKVGYICMPRSRGASVRTRHTRGTAPCHNRWRARPGRRADLDDKWPQRRRGQARQARGHQLARAPGSRRMPPPERASPRTTFTHGRLDGGRTRITHGRSHGGCLRALPRVLYTDGCIRVSHTALVSHTDGARRVLEALAGGAAALVEFRLETGRTHQARLSFYIVIDYHCP